jgi:hypothetical protein
MESLRFFENKITSNTIQDRDKDFFRDLLEWEWLNSAGISRAGQG